jgi:hypothetical protein
MPHPTLLTRVRSVLACLLMAVLLVAAAGCATSKPFALGLPKIGASLDRELHHYAGADARRVADVDAFLLAARTDGTTAAAADRAWQPVRAWYVPAFEADAALDPDELRLRRDQVARLDKLLGDERGRPLATPR